MWVSSTNRTTAAAAARGPSDRYALPACRSRQIHDLHAGQFTSLICRFMLPLSWETAEIEAYVLYVMTGNGDKGLCK